MKKLVFIAILLALATMGAKAQEKPITEDDGFQWYRIVSNDRKYQGAVNIDGDTIIPLSRHYSKVCYRTTVKPRKRLKNKPVGYFIVEKEENRGVYITYGRGNIPIRYPNPAYGKMGACDIYGREIIAPIYERIDYFCTAKGTGGQGFIYKSSEVDPYRSGGRFDVVLDNDCRASRYVHSSAYLPSTELLFQGIYYSNGMGVESLTGKIYQGPVGTYNITVYNDHLVVNGKYCEDASSDEWSRKTGRYKAFGYSWNHTINSWGYAHDEFFQVDEKTQEIKLFCRDQHPSGFPIAFHITLINGNATIPNMQFDPSFQQPQYQQYQQPQYQQYPQYQQPQQNQYQQSQPTPPQPQQKKICKWCNGTKRIEKNDGFTLGLGEKEYCRECGKTVMSGHYHTVCPYCHGTGYE